MAAVRVPAAFEHVEEAGDVGIDVVVRRREGVADAGLGGEMDHMGEAEFRKQRRHAVAVLEVELAETECIEAGELGEARLLERGIVIGIEVVDADHGAPARREALGDVEADESGGAGDQDRLSRHRSSSPRMSPAISASPVLLPQRQGDRRPLTRPLDTPKEG